MERTLLEWLRRRLPADTTNRLPLGLSDDAALLQLAEQGACVITTDMLCDGVHFQAEQLDLDLIGRKAIAVNLSDLAAMAAVPLALFVSIAIPRSWEQTKVEAVYEGMMTLSSEFDCPIAGGDTNRWDGPLVINVVAVGQPPPGGVWRRAGGRQGDLLLVTGELGGSLLEHHYSFQPRIHEALLLANQYDIHAALDLSDGLALDCSRLAAASRCGALLDLESIPISSAAMRLANQTDYSRTPLTHALSDGEDFELLLAAAPAEARRLLEDRPLDVPLTLVGELIEAEGLWHRTDAGDLEPLEASGYLHD
jgi:thiamine-monophosphate kinase